MFDTRRPIGVRALRVTVLGLIAAVGAAVVVAPSMADGAAVSSLDGTAKATRSAVRIGPTRPTSPVGLTALDVLATILVRNETPSSYDRDLFGYPSGQGNGCDTRDRVLIAESLSPAQVSYPGCAVIAGDWYSSYDNETTSDPTDLEIDHLVPLKEAWDSGARTWTTTQRRAFANDLDDERSLIAVTSSSNRSKGAADPSNWIPPHQASVCGYLSDWVAVKARWSLSMDQSEHGRIKNLLQTCPTITIDPINRQQPADPPSPTTTSTTTPPANCDPSYPTVCIPPGPPDLNCDDVPYTDFRVLQPDPHGFDRDKDGYGCTS